MSQALVTSAKMEAEYMILSAAEMLYRLTARQSASNLILDATKSHMMAPLDSSWKEQLDASVHFWSAFCRALLLLSSISSYGGGNTSASG